MYSEEESLEGYIDCLSSESDSSYECPICFSKLNHQWKDVLSKKPSSVQEKIKLFSGSSPLLLQKQTKPDTKILNKKNPWELDQTTETSYESRTEICKTANGN